MQYEIRPITEFTQDETLIELCRALGRGELSQRVAQAAAWHLANDMSWEDLAAKEFRTAPWDRRPWFNRDELAAAMTAVAQLENLVENEGTPRRPSDESQNTPASPAASTSAAASESTSKDAKAAGKAPKARRRSGSSSSKS
jgi:hypothetical protein